MEIKTTSQINELWAECFGTLQEYDCNNIKWIKVDDEKERLSHTIEFIKQFCIKMHKTDESEHCDCDRYILTILRHINELSKSNPADNSLGKPNASGSDKLSNPDDSVSQKRHVDSGNDTFSDDEVEKYIKRLS